MSKTNPSANFLRRAKEILGDGGWIDDPAELEPFVHEWRDRWHGHTPFLAQPDRPKQLAAFITLCAHENIAITTQGGNTGLVGGQIPMGEVLLSTRRLSQICTIDAPAMTMTLGAGITLDHAIEQAERHGLVFPMQLASGGSATIGGMVATNAGGMGVLRYGNMRDLVLGVEVVLANGEILGDLSPLRKDNTGYDLSQIFIGSEGTLGVISTISVRLFPQPKTTHTAWCAVQSPDQALALLGYLRAHVQNSIAKFELVSDFALSLVLQSLPAAKAPLPSQSPFHVLVEFHDGHNIEHALEQAMKAGLLIDAVLAQSQREAAELLALREHISAAQKPHGIAIKHDISLPLSQIGAFLDESEQYLAKQYPAARICAFGHLGDGNLHYNILLPTSTAADQIKTMRRQISRAIYDMVHEKSGSFSAEHGIGIAKIGEMTRYKSPTQLAVHRAIKHAFDPGGLLNPRLSLPK